MILASADGYFGGEIVPPHFTERVEAGKFFVWPLMAMLWAFDVEAVARRSLMVDWIRDCSNQREALIKIYMEREELGIIRRSENLPRHEDMRVEGGMWQ